MRQNTRKLTSSVLLVLALLAIAIPNVNADETCKLDSELINQDPYPSIAGDYMEVLFQITGTGNCEDGAEVKLVLEYPFSLDSGDYTRTLDKPTYAGEGFNSNWNVVYKIRIDKNALEDIYELKLEYSERTGGASEVFFKKFEVNVEDGLTDFEVHIENYNIKERNLVFEILNIGNQDVEALTVEIPKQEGIVVKGSNRNIVGDLDSNEYTTASFEALPEEGGIVVDLYYTDSINERRHIKKVVDYDPNYFADSLENKPKGSNNSYIIITLVVLIAGFFGYKKYKKSKKSNKKREFSV